MKTRTRDPQVALAEFALVAAAMGGNEELVEYLLEAFPAMDLECRMSTPHGRMTAAGSAAHSNAPGALESLHRRGAKLSSLSCLNDLTPLHIACQRGNREAAAYLLQHDPAVDQRASGLQGFTPLLYACANNHALLACDLLLKAGADPNLATLDTGHTPLHLACTRGEPLIARALLNAGAEPHPVNAFGETPVHHARRHQYSEDFLGMFPDVSRD